MNSAVHQLVNSPIRNALNPKERRAMRAGMSRSGRVVARGLRRTVRRAHRDVDWKVDEGPVFDNCLGQLIFDGASARLVQEHSCPSDDGSAYLELLYSVDLATEQLETARPASSGGGSSGTTRPIEPRSGS